MRIIEPKVELWQQDDPIVHVARCARVCYGSPTEGKSTVQDLYDRLLKAKHNSMFRHESVYAIIPKDEDSTFDLKPFYYCPYIDITIDANEYYIATNRNFIIDYKDKSIAWLIDNFKVTPEEFANTEVGWNMMRYTFHITTQISTSRELNRVSPNNIAEKSTRYVHEDGTIVRPHWLNPLWNNIVNEQGYPPKEIFLHDSNAFAYLVGVNQGFISYKRLIEKGFKRQDARGVLPLDTATEVVYTYSVDEWKHIIALRSAKNAHPNAQIIANAIKESLEMLGYDDI